MMQKKPTAPLYFWFDLEFTDLDPDKAHILQVAALITDVHLQPVKPNDPGINLAVALPPAATVSEWVQTNLKELLDTCRGPSAVFLANADTALADYLDRVAGPPAEDVKERPVMAGNSVHNDWRLACKQLPTIGTRLHYRLLDVTSFKLHWQDWAGQPEFDKDDVDLVKQHLPFPFPDFAGKAHDAFFDILASIAELNFYRQRLLRR